MGKLARVLDLQFLFWRQKTSLRQYAFAILTIAIASVARYALGVYAGLTRPFVLFYPAVLIISFFGGLWPSVAATFLSAGIAELFFISHRGAAPTDRSEQFVVPALFCVLGILTSAFVDAGRRRAEQAVRAGEDRYRDLVEHSEDLLCTHDLEGSLLTVNPTPARILGYSVEELLKIPMRDLIVPEGREEFDKYLERLRSTGQPEHGLLCVICKSGEVRTWEYHNTLRTDGVDKPIVRGMAHDVTERRRAQLALQESEQRERARAEELETVLDTLPVPVLIAHDAECKNITANSAGYEHFALPAGSNLSLATSDEPPPFQFRRGDSGVPKDQLPLDLAVATGLPVRNAAITLVLPDGTEKHQLGNAAPLLDAEGKVRGAVTGSRIRAIGRRPHFACRCPHYCRDESRFEGRCSRAEVPRRPLLPAERFSH